MRIDNNGLLNMYSMDARTSVKMNDNAASLNNVQVDAKNVEKAQKPEEAYKVPTKNEDIANLAFDFKKDNSFNLIGAKSKMEDMDVDKALDQMKKDSVLSQYKFFVKPQMNSGLGTDEDGTVKIVKRN